MKYTAISIGPIIATLSQVRKPRQLWSASYLFSHLMSIIIEEGEKLGGELISPAKSTSEKPEIVGLYPDRAFFKNELNLKELTNEVLKVFSGSIGIKSETLNNYFNIMCVSIDAGKESEAITLLNKKLDALELANRCEDSNARKEVLKLITKRKKSPLFNKAFDDENFDIPWLSLIAGNELKCKSEEAWNEIVNKVKSAESKKAREKAENDKQNKKKSEEEYWDFIDEADFYEQISENGILNQHFKSYHKYFCVVQADGDKMGSVIANLQNGNLCKLSKALIQFGKKASELIKDFGGLPIYAGGDDLLFIAPVVSEKKGRKEKMNIFGLITQIDELYGSVVKEAENLQTESKEETSMSYGISINYYKHPLYEVLETARTLLFDVAKNKRNSIACKLQKHSGSVLEVTLDKKEKTLKGAFDDLIDIAVSENMVSATAHKLRENEALWRITNGEKSRIEGFFQNMMGLGEKDNEQNDYLRKVKEIMINMFDANKIEKKKDTQLYSMLRIAKFINGEEVKDE